jgi:hypothetical protein
MASSHLATIARWSCDLQNPLNLRAAVFGTSRQHFQVVQDLRLAAAVQVGGSSSRFRQADQLGR